LKISKLTGLRLLIYLLFLSNTVGFDFYSHSLIYYFNKNVITHSYLIFDTISLPRYGLLSVFYEVISRIGVPPGFLAIFLLYPPIFTITKYLFISKNDSKVNFYKFLIFVLLCYLVLFYSGTSLAILYVISYFMSKKKYFLLGVFFHPILIFVSVISLFFINRKIYIWFILNFSIIFYLFFIGTKFQILTCFASNNIKLDIQKDIIIELLEYTYSNKSGEINLFIILSISVIFITKTFIGKILNILKSMKFSLFFLKSNLFFFLIVINFYFTINGADSLFINIIKFKMTDVIYVSWFDFGYPDYSGSFDDINESRIYK
jgi:hypothetical protein